MKTSYDHYREYQKAIRAILKRYTVTLKENPISADMGVLKDQQKAFLSFYKTMEKEMRAEERKALKLAKDFPDFDNLHLKIGLYTIKKGVEFISKHKPR